MKPFLPFQIDARLRTFAGDGPEHFRGSPSSSYLKLTFVQGLYVVESPLMQNQALEIERVEDSTGATVLRLHGPLLLGNFFSFQSTVRADSAPLLIVDMADVPYIDSAGIGCLVGAQVSRANSGRTLVLVGAPDRVLTSLKVTKVFGLFKYAASVEAAHQTGETSA